MRRIIFYLFFILISFKGYSITYDTLSLDSCVKNAIQFSSKQLQSQIIFLGTETNKYPTFSKYDTTLKKWVWNYSSITPSKAGDWACGFFPGTLWKMYEITKDTFWMIQATKWTMAIEYKVILNASDVGSNVYSSFFPLVKYTQNAIYKNILLNGAKRITGSNYERFYARSGAIGYLRKADLDKKNHHQAFNDHMPDLELLYWGAKNSPDTIERFRFDSIARSHALTMGKYSLNPIIYKSHPEKYRRGSVQRNYFDYTTGNFLFGEAKQAWNHTSTWSRGQSWYVYGFAAAYEASKNDSILAFAKMTINYFISHLPAFLPDDRKIKDDYIPQWDFDYTSQRDSVGKLLFKDTERDASAASMAIAGIFKLIQAMPITDSQRLFYWTIATKILHQLCKSNYLAETHNSPALLMHSCYHHPKCYVGGNVADVSTTWADYFFLHAIEQYVRMRDSIDTSGNEIFVELTSPIDKQLITEKDTMHIAADAFHLKSKILRVEFYLDTIKIGECDTLPYQMKWKNLVAGKYTIRAKAIDDSLKTLYSLPVSITIFKTFKPEFSIITPNDSSIITQGNIVDVNTSVYDRDGFISNVYFFVDDSLYMKDSIEPYTLSYNDTIPGIHQLIAYAMDDDSLISLMDTVHFIIEKPNHLSELFFTASIYPNPCRNKLYIDINDLINNFVEVDLTSISGNRILVKRINYFDELDVSMLKSGIYILRIKTQKGIIVRKIIKE